LPPAFWAWKQQPLIGPRDSGRVAGIVTRRSQELNGRSNKFGHWKAEAAVGKQFVVAVKQEMFAEDEVALSSRPHGRA
jgi:hypothetical protein